MANGSPGPLRLRLRDALEADGDTRKQATLRLHSAAAFGAVRSQVRNRRAAWGSAGVRLGLWSPELLRSMLEVVGGSASTVPSVTPLFEGDESRLTDAQWDSLRQQGGYPCRTPPGTVVVGVPALGGQPGLRTPMPGAPALDVRDTPQVVAERALGTGFTRSRDEAEQEIRFLWVGLESQQSAAPGWPSDWRQPTRNLGVSEDLPDVEHVRAALVGTVHEVSLVVGAVQGERSVLNVLRGRLEEARRARVSPAPALLVFDHLCAQLLPPLPLLIQLSDSLRKVAAGDLRQARTPGDFLPAVNEALARADRAEIRCVEAAQDAISAAGGRVVVTTGSNLVRASLLAWAARNPSLAMQVIEVRSGSSPVQQLRPLPRFALRQRPSAVRWDFVGTAAEAPAEVQTVLFGGCLVNRFGILAEEDTCRVLLELRAAPGRRVHALLGTHKFLLDDQLQAELVLQTAPVTTYHSLVRWGGAEDVVVG